ncbi:hypothetical protein [Nonomuraea ceibae]|uniref:hypothetical protein n=1 Tax=Nonomuraea ceibae TaxID=1935170 RepID=UPI001C5D2BEA|nr:hypothetical protein [Nonomuraea ceibae]
MTRTQTSKRRTNHAPEPDAPAASEQDPLSGPDYPAHAWIPRSRIEPNPLNKRKDYDLNEDFLQTLRDGDGPEVDFIVFPSPDTPGMFRLHDGHRRWFGLQRIEELIASEMREAGQQPPPGEPEGERQEPAYACRIKTELTHDIVGQLLGQVRTGRHAKALNDRETAAALFELDGHGVTRETLKQATGWSAQKVAQAIQAGALSEASQAAIADVRPNYTPDLSDYEAWCQLQHDPDMEAEALAHMKNSGMYPEHAAKLVIRQRQEKATFERLMAEHQAAGITVTDGQLPDGAVELYHLPRDGDGNAMSAEEHAQCPGHAAYFPSLTRASYYCATPALHGYQPAAEQPQAKAQLPMKKIRQGNTEYRLAVEERQKFWKGALRSRTDPDQRVLRIVVDLLEHDMPEPLRSKFGQIHTQDIYTELVAPVADNWIASARTAQLTWRLFGRYVATMEWWMSQRYSDSLWRLDRSMAASRHDAARWLRIAEQLGHTLAPIEQAIIAGIQYLDEEAAVCDGLAGDEQRPAPVADPDEDLESGPGATPMT